MATPLRPTTRPRLRSHQRKSPHPTFRSHAAARRAEHTPAPPRSARDRGTDRTRMCAYASHAVAPSRGHPHRNWLVRSDVLSRRGLWVWTGDRDRVCTLRCTRQWSTKSKARANGVGLCRSPLVVARGQHTDVDVVTVTATRVRHLHCAALPHRAHRDGHEPQMRDAAAALHARPGAMAMRRWEWERGTRMVARDHGGW